MSGISSHGSMYVNLTKYSTIFANTLQVAKFVSIGPSDTPHTSEDTEAKLETECQLNNWQSVEQTAKNDTPTSSESVVDPDIVNVVGDIIHVCHLPFLCTAKRPNFSLAYSSKDR